MSDWHIADRDADVDTLTPALGGLEWGFNSPGAFVLARVLPTGRLYVERDMRFVHQSVPDVAKAITRMIADCQLPKRPMIYASPDLFGMKEPDEGVMVEAIAEVFGREGCPLVQSHGDELHGWQRFNDYFRVAPDGKPWMQMHPRCQTLIRTIPTIMQHDTNPEEPRGAMFAAHALRRLLNARPSISALTHAKEKPACGTVGWLKTKDSKPRGTLAMS